MNHASPKLSFNLSEGLVSLFCLVDIQGEGRDFTGVGGLSTDTGSLLLGISGLSPGTGVMCDRFRLTVPLPVSTV